MTISRHRLKQIHVPDTYDDSLSSTDISNIELQAVNLEDLSHAVLSQIKKIIHGDDNGNWNDDLSSIFNEPISLNNLLKLTNRTGFDRNSDGVLTASCGDISFEDNTRTFTIQPQIGENNFYFFVNGKKTIKTTPEQIVISDVEGVHYIYFDSNGVIQETTTFDIKIITEYVFTSNIYWDKENQKNIVFGDERHGSVISPATHIYLHRTFGSVYHGGIDIENLTTDGSGNDDTSIQFSNSSGNIADEDIPFTISTSIFPAQIPVYYRLGVNGDWREKTPDNFPIIYNGTAGYSDTLVPYNHYNGATWMLTSLTNNDYIVMLYFATNDLNRPIIGVQGQNDYANLTQARDGIQNELNNFAKGSLPFVEFVACWSLIIQTSTVFSNTPKAIFRKLLDGSDFYDLRRIRGGLVFP